MINFNPQSIFTSLKSLIYKVSLSLIIFIQIAFIGLPLPTQAAGFIPSKETICNGACPLFDSEFQVTDRESIANFILGLARFLTYISGALAVLFIVYGAFMIVTDWGDGKRAEKGWANIRTSLIGLVVVIVAYTVVGFIGGLTTGDSLSQFLIQG